MDAASTVGRLLDFLPSEDARFRGTCGKCSIGGTAAVSSADRLSLLTAAQIAKKMKDTELHRKLLDLAR